METTYIVVQKQSGTQRIAHHPTCPWIGKRPQQAMAFIEPGIQVCNRCKGVEFVKTVFIPSTKPRPQVEIIDGVRIKKRAPRKPPPPKPVGEYYLDFSHYRGGRLTPKCCPTCGNTDLFWENPAWSCYICNWYGKIIKSTWKQIDAPPLYRRRSSWPGERREPRMSA